MTDTIDPVNALEAALEAAADADMVGSRLDPKDLAPFVVKTLTALGAVMPDEAAKLRTEVDRLETVVSVLGETDRFSYADCRGDCDGCHEGPRQCDCHITGEEAREVIRSLRGRVEHAEDLIGEVTKERQKVYAWERRAVAQRDQAEAERDALREQVADALALCREIRPDSVIGTSPAVWLKLIEDRLSMPTRGDRG